jgi:type I restriction enzyme R subunit
MALRIKSPERPTDHWPAIRARAVAVAPNFPTKRDWIGPEGKDGALMALNEADTRAKLIDPALHARGWTEDLIHREETAGSVEIIGGKPHRRAKGRTDYTLRIQVHTDTQPVAVALIEAKAESLPPTHGLEQGKCYAACNRLNVPFVFSSNGHRFVWFNRLIIRR